MPAIALTLADSGSAVDVRVGDRLTLRLDENPTTGYRWAMDPPDGEVVALEHVKYKPSAGAAVGGGGQRTWTFIARKAGMATLRLKLWRAWEGDASVSARFTATLRVHEWTSQRRSHAMAYMLGGHLPDPHDDDSLRSYWDFEALKPHLAAAPGDADLRPYSSPRHNQGQTGSCVAQSVVKALENLERQQLCRQRGINPSQLQPGDHHNLSVLALYYLCREKMQPSRVHEDKGTYIHLACDCLRLFGVCTEEEWPFDPARVFEAPRVLAMREAYDHKISAYYRIKTAGHDLVTDVIAALRTSHPVVYGTAVGDNWTNYRAGEVLGRPSDPEGAHATHLVGWDQGRGVFIGENSWGTTWGDDGYYLIAPEVIADPSSHDFWVITGSWEEVHR